MSRLVKIELSDEMFAIANDLARRQGQTVEQWAAAHLASSIQPSRNGDTNMPPPSAELMSFAGCVSIDDPTWSDNERIDRELAEEYGNDHEAKP